MEAVFGILLMLILFAVAAIVVIGVTYSIANYIYCSGFDNGKKPSFYKIERNGDSTISLFRKELFMWNAQDIGEWSQRTSLPDTEENIEFLKEAIAKERKAIKDRIQRKIDKAAALEKHNKSPKVIHTDP